MFVPVLIQPHWCVLWECVLLSSLLSLCFDDTIKEENGREIVYSECSNSLCVCIARPVSTHKGVSSGATGGAVNKGQQASEGAMRCEESGPN